MKINLQQAIRLQMTLTFIAASWTLIGHAAMPHVTSSVQRAVPNEMLKEACIFAGLVAVYGFILLWVTESLVLAISTLIAFIFCLIAFSSLT